MTVERNEVKNVEIQVTEYLLKLGIPAHIKGYYYLRSAIIMTLRDSDMLSAVTKVLYPALAKEYKSTIPRCERAIRHAIDTAWKRGDRTFINEVFGFTVNAQKGKPTNSEFIAIITDRLRLDNLRPVGYKLTEIA